MVRNLRSSFFFFFFFLIYFFFNIFFYFHLKKLLIVKQSLLLKHLDKCIENSMENMHSDVKVKKVEGNSYKTKNNNQG